MKKETALFLSRTGAISKRALFITDGFDYSNLTKDQIRIALVFRLPFRLRFAQCASIFDDVSSTWQVAIYNRIPFPKGSDFGQLIKGHPANYRILWTDAMVIHPGSSLTDDEVSVLQQGRELQQRLNEDVQASVLRPVFDFRRLLPQSLRPLNVMVVASTRACVAKFGLLAMFGVSPIRTLTLQDLNHLLTSQVPILCPKDYVIGPSDVERIVTAGLEFEAYTEGAIYEDAYDLDGIGVKEIQQVLDSIESDVFHELAFQADSYMAKQEYQVAILLSVAALEAVHGAFLRAVLGKMLPGRSEDSPAIDAFMREEGFHTLLQITPYIFMNEATRPDEVDLKRCLRAVEIRNAIMHGLAKKGIPRMRKYSDQELIDAYIATQRVQACYLNALMVRGRSVHGEHRAQDQKAYREAN